MHTAPAPAPALTRLHITPLTPALLAVYIPPSVLPSVQNISFHTIDTFPERSYGYVDIPAMEADRLRKKLNGSILKGSKVSIEEARPPKKRKSEDGEPNEERKKFKQAKGGKGVVPGVELPAGKKVVRGWTESAGERSKLEKKRERKAKEKAEKKEKAKADKINKTQPKRSKPSKYTKQPELLFKTTLPPNKVGDLKSSTSSKNKDKYNKTKKKGEVVVHEFTKTTKHVSFLKNNQPANGGKPASEYVEDKGWVDEDGNVVEAHKKKARSNSLDEDAKIDSSKTAPSKVKSKAAVSSEEDEAADDSEESSVLSDSSVVSSSSSSEDSDDDSEDDSEADSDIPVQSDEEKPKTTLTTRSKSSSKTTVASGKADKGESKKGLDLSVQEGFTASTTALEALYKRPAFTHNTPTPRPAPILTSFSFFDGDPATGDGDENEDGLAPLKEPQTPFTRQDREWRDQRSAAPTPDTAAIGKRFIFPDPDDEDEDDSDDEIAEEDVTEAQSRAKDDKPEGEGDSEFSKWFWENRGEKNRAWKKRRREALKVKRQRENRRVGRRVV